MLLLFQLKDMQSVMKLLPDQAYSIFTVRVSETL